MTELRILNDEEISDIVSSCKEWYEIPGKVSKAQHQVDLKAFTELLESHKFHDDYGGESAMIYRDSLVESLKQMENINRGMEDAKDGRVSKIDMEEL